VRLAAWILPICLMPSALAAPKSCIAPEAAAGHVNKDVCIAGHVYDVVELSDGTRFLDLCRPSTPDEECRFTVVSRDEDRKEVGDLNRYRGQDVQIRGIVRPFNSHTEISLNRERQFHGGSEKFQPNPALLKGFSAENSATAFRDPTARASRHRSTFSPRH